MTSISRIVKIGDTDISSYVEWGPRRAKGAGRKMNTSPIIGSNRAVVWQEGRDPLTLSAGLIFRPDLTDQIGEADDVTALIDDLSGDQETDRLYFGRADRFAVVYGSVGDTEIAPAAGGGGIVRKTAEFWAEAAELYATTPSTWSPTDEILPITQDTGESNGGNIDAPLYSLALTARMSGPALKLDGTNDYIDIGAVDLSGDALSVEMWITFLSTTLYDGLFSIGDSLTESGSLHIYLESGAVKFGFGDGNWIPGGIGSPLSADQKIHLLLTYDVSGNKFILYENGAEKLAWTPTAPTVLVTLANDSEVMGYLTGLNYANVVFHSARVWKRVLTADEAEDAYLGETVSDTSLVIEYDFCEGQGATVYDLSGNSNDGTLTNFADTSAGYGDTHDDGWLTSIGPVSPALELLDGATEVDSLALASHLMTAEVLAQDRFGTTITQTYVDDFSADIGRPAFGNGYFPADGYCYAKYIDSEIVLTSKISGRVGEEISITITDTDQAILSVSVSGYDITVDLDTSGGNPISTAQEVIDAINADGDASALVTASLASGEDGTTVLGTQAKTQLALNVAVTGGALVIEDDREAEYHLVGQWPIKRGGLMVTFTPTEAGTGEAFLEASIDQGDSWLEVSSNSRWVDGAENKVYVPQAEGYVEVWIRWRCDGDITSLSIDDLQIVQLRAVSDADVPKIPVGEERVLQVSGTGRAIISAEYRDRYKP